MAYAKSDPRHPMNAERTGGSTVTVVKKRPAKSYGMKDRKKGVNCSTGRYATK